MWDGFVNNFMGGGRNHFTVLCLYKITVYTKHLTISYVKYSSTKLKKISKIKNWGRSHMVQQGKDLLLPQVWYRSQHWHRFDSWPRNFHMPQVQHLPPKKRKKNWKKGYILNALLPFYWASSLYLHYSTNISNQYYPPK